MNVSLNPTYLCNLRCEFCYLGDKLGDPKRADLAVIDKRLAEISNHSKIEHIDLYGGEVQLLPEDYITDLFRVIGRYYNGKVNVVTNLTHITPLLSRDDVDVSVSFDFECRTGFKRTLQNLAIMSKPVALLMLASPCLVKLDVNYMIQTLNSLACVKSVEIKPYSSNQYNQHGVTFRDFEEFVKRFFQNPTPLRATFVNEMYLQESLQGYRNAFSDDHVYITPSGNFGVLDFDENDNEFFSELDSIDKYFSWRQAEKERVASNTICASCPYFGKCLTEHYRDVKSLEHSCNGFRFLLDWYNERTQNSAKNLSQNSAFY